jgi:hypothetical protein
LEFRAKARFASRLTGEFAVWELEIKDEKVVTLAIDFVQRPDPKKEASATGKIRLNSKFE